MQEKVPAVQEWKWNAVARSEVCLALSDKKSTVVAFGSGQSVPAERTAVDSEDRA